VIQADLGVKKKEITGGERAGGVDAMIQPNEHKPLCSSPIIPKSNNIWKIGFTAQSSTHSRGTLFYLAELPCLIFPFTSSLEMLKAPGCDV
jgi:hypothetical protein